MTTSLDLSTTFIHLADTGDAEPIEVTRAFWAGAGASYDRVLGCVDFSADEDLHSSMQEMHPVADEVLYVVEGAVDVVLQHDDAERTIALESGQATIVARGVWHRLIMRRPGRLLFINSRDGMQGRQVRHNVKTRQRSD